MTFMAISAFHPRDKASYFKLILRLLECRKATQEMQELKLKSKGLKRHFWYRKLNENHEKSLRGS